MRGHGRRSVRHGVGSCPRIAGRAGTSTRRRTGSPRGAHAASGREVLLGARREMAVGRLIEHLLGPEGLAAPDHPVRGEIEDPNVEPERMVRCGKPRQLLEPPDERLRVAHPDPHVDLADEPIAGESRPCLRQARDARRRPSRPGRSRGYIEAKLANLRPRLVDVRPHLPTGTKRVDHDRPSAREDELAQVDVPVALARPADVLARRNGLAGLHDRIDVPVAEVADARKATRATWSGEEHGAALDGEHPVRPAGRRTLLGPVVAHGDVDPRRDRSRRARGRVAGPETSRESDAGGGAAFTGQPRHESL